MNFIFECSGRNDISRVSAAKELDVVKFISLSQRVMFFFIWRPDVIEICDFYFIVFEKSSKFYISPFVFTENTKHPC